MLSSSARAALDELESRVDPSILGLVLSGSAARDLTTEHSDVDVFVVRHEDANRDVSRTAAIDEIQLSLA